MLTSVLIAIAAMRARRRKRETLARWGEEEAAMDRLRLEARERQLQRMRETEAAAAVTSNPPAAAVSAEVIPAVRVHAVRRPAAPEPPDYLVPMPLAEPRESDVPTVRHEGRDHTLH